MPRTINLRFTGQAEDFIDELKKEGLSEQEIMAKALWLLYQVKTTGRVALLEKPESDNTEAKVEYRFRL